MLISKELEKAINEQVGREFGAAMQYVNIASYFTSANMLLFGKLFFKQAEEEIQHGTKFVRYVLDAGGSVAVPAIPAGRADFKSAEEAVAAALKWEETVTGQINALMDVAVKEKDYIAQQFLGWFVKEQLEEVSKMSTILSVIQRAGDNLLLAERYVKDTLAEIESVEGGP
ncbi:MAG: ferritin [Anaerolineales bacterium]